jgi:ABC-type nickel/cobalt efflux system permease component RcnA
MSFDVLFHPAEQLDTQLESLFAGASFGTALLVAFLLGLRHASDPDHLVAVTSLVAADGGDTRRATRLGVFWGIGHASILLVLGLPLIALKGEMPAWLEASAEKLVGVVILALAVRVLAKWLRGDYRAGRHDGPARPGRAHRHLRRGHSHEHEHVRTPRQALGIGVVHGLAGTGAVVLLLVAALPTRWEAAAALAVFAPMSVLSMAMCTSAFSWALTRPVLEPVYRTVLIPAFGLFALMFGTWYVGLT